MSREIICHSVVCPSLVCDFVLQSNQLGKNLMLLVSVEHLIREVSKVLLINKNDKFYQLQVCSPLVHNN
jgi:hypothetical protein